MLKEILEKRFTARWWLDKSVEKEKLEYILDCALTVPSKQSRYSYEICVLGDSEKSKEIKDWIYWEDSYCINDVRAKDEKKDPIGQRAYNGQCRAPVVLAFIGKKENVKHAECCNDIMISVTTAMLAAEEQGLNTGFQACLGELEVAKKLGKKGFCHILLGIGYIDKYDTENIALDPSIFFAGRFVYKDNIKYGYDDGNNPVEDLRGRHRKNLAALGVGKRSLVDYI